MFKKVLIISDNLFLCERIVQVIINKNYNLELLKISISPQSNIEEFSREIGMPIDKLNLKDTKVVDYIIKTFDLVFSVHCKQLFPSVLINSVKCINIHPGYNPVNRGWYPQVFSIIYNLPIGATIHEMDNKLDNGRIISREYVEKEVYDTSLTLYDKILKKEIELFENNINSIIYKEYKTSEPESDGNLFLKEDFNKLLQLNLNEELTLGKCIDKLRALSHGNFKNAYFIDNKSGKRVYVYLKLEVDED